MLNVLFFFLYLYTFSFGLFAFCHCVLHLQLAFFVMVYLEIKWIDSQKFYLFYFYNCSYLTKEKKD